MFFFFFWWVEKPSPQPLLPGSLPPPPPPTLQRFSTERDVYVPVSPCHTQESISSAWLASSGVPPPELNAQPCKDRDPLLREREPPGVPEACENGRTEASRSPPAPACLAAAHFHRICGLRLWRVTHLPPLLSLSKCQVTLAIPSPSAAPPPHFWWCCLPRLDQSAFREKIETLLDPINENRAAGMCLFKISLPGQGKDWRGREGGREPGWAPLPSPDPPSIQKRNPNF